MIVIEKILQVRSELKKHQNKKVAFVPTMGALHEGHLSLVKKAQEFADIVVVSIFVNKTQFNDAKDFAKYPRQTSLDIEKLSSLKVDYIFIPQDEEMFANNFSFRITENSLTNCLCGATRPGHFDGVALILTKFFNIIKPQIALFGQKDFQQLLVVKKLVQDLNFDIEIIGCDIAREPSGLAMSSRNQRLSDVGKIKAANIFRILTEVKNAVRDGEKNIVELISKKSEELLQFGFEKIDYFEIRFEANLELAVEFNKPCRIFIAAYLEGIRLIDNLRVN